VKNIDQLPVKMVEIHPENVQSDDYPVCVAGFTGVEGWCRIPDNTFLCKRDYTVKTCLDARNHGVQRLLN